MNLKAVFAVSIAILLLLSFIGVFCNVQTTSGSGTGNFTIKSAQISVSDVNPSAYGSYISNWKTLFAGMGLNTVRVTSSNGAGAGMDQVNMVDNPVAWAQNLENALTTLTGKDRFGFGTSTGINKVWWQSFSAPWGSNFGIYSGWGTTFDNTPSLVSNGGSTWVSLVTSYEIANGYPTTKAYLDKLAGNNALGHNFLSDPRILGWSPFNECGMQYGTSDLYHWVIWVMDYIHSKGGLTIANCPILNLADKDWQISFQDTAPLFVGHADYIETHNYALTMEWDPTHTYHLTDSLEAAMNSGRSPNAAWTAWRNYVVADLTPQMYWANVYGWDAYHVIEGEFGIWVGAASDVNFNYDVSDDNSADYVSNYYSAAASAGYKCMNYYTGTGFPAASKITSYGILIRNYDGSTIVHGGYNEMALAYSGNANVEPTPTPTPAPTNGGGGGGGGGGGSTPTPTPSSTPSPTNVTSEWSKDLVFLGSFGLIGGVSSLPLIGLVTPVGRVLKNRSLHRMFRHKRVYKHRRYRRR